MRFFILLLLFTGCSSPPVPTSAPTQSPTPTPTATPTATPTPTPSPSPTSVDYPYIGPTELQPYVNKFIDYGAKYGRNLDVSDVIIQFGSLAQYGSGVIGLCELSGSMPRVTLNDKWWYQVDQTQRLLLFLHELGHCSLYRQHLTSKNTDGNPVSIMYPLIISNSTYVPNKDAYDRELYTKSSLVDEDQDTFICTEREIGEGVQENYE
jgi:hypothetical protein